MPHSEFIPHILLKLGPVEVTTTVLESLIVSAVLITFAFLVRIGLGRKSSGWQTSPPSKARRRWFLCE